MSAQINYSLTFFWVPFLPLYALKSHLNTGHKVKREWGNLLIKLNIVIFIYGGMIRKCHSLFFILFFTLILLWFLIILHATHPLGSEPDLKETAPLAWEKPTDVNGLLWGKWARQPKDQRQRFPAWSATTGRPEALKFGWGGHQSRTHQVHIPPNRSFHNKNTQLWHEGNTPICSMNSFLAHNACRGSRTLHGCLKTYYCG